MVRPLSLPVEVHLDGMIDDEVCGANGVDPFWIAAQLHDCVAHGGEVHHGGNAAAGRSVQTHGRSERTPGTHLYLQISAGI